MAKKISIWCITLKCIMTTRRTTRKGPSWMNKASTVLQMSVLRWERREGAASECSWGDTVITVEKWTAQLHSISSGQIERWLLSGKSSNVFWFRDSGSEEKTGAAIKMLSFPLGVNKMDGNRKEGFRGSDYAGCLGDKAREGRLLRWFGQE